MRFMVSAAIGDTIGNTEIIVNAALIIVKQAIKYKTDDKFDL